MLVQPPIASSLSFMDSTRICFKGYFKFSGRGRRSEFWWFFLLCDIILGFLGSLLRAFIIYDCSYYSYYYCKPRLTTGFYVYLGFYILVDIALLIPFLAASTRRLHDIGYSGYYNFLLLVPIVNLYLLYLWYIDSQAGANIYGPATKYNLNQNDPLLNASNNGQVIQPVIQYPVGQPVIYQPQVITVQPNAYQGVDPNIQGVQNINQIGIPVNNNIYEAPQENNAYQGQPIPVAEPNNNTPVENQENNQ